MRVVTFVGWLSWLVHSTKEAKAMATVWANYPGSVSGPENNFPLPNQECVPMATWETEHAIRLELYKSV